METLSNVPLPLDATVATAAGLQQEVYVSVDVLSINEIEIIGGTRMLSYVCVDLHDRSASVTCSLVTVGQSLTRNRSSVVVKKQERSTQNCMCM